MPPQVENKEKLEKIKQEEATTLSGIYDGLVQVKLFLQEGDFALAQGALTGIFNGIGNFISKSQYLDQGKKNRLIALNELLYDSRNILVDQVEVMKRDLESVIETYHFYERLDFLSETLKENINKWYRT